MFAIVQWSSFKDIAVVTGEDGAPMLFLFRREAERWAKENIACHWQILYLLADE